MQRIEVLGTGCAKCKKLKEACDRAVQELGVDAEIVKVEDINKIMEFGVMMTPALAIDGQVKVAGKVPSVDQIKAYLA